MELKENCEHAVEKIFQSTIKQREICPLPIICLLWIFIQKKRKKSIINGIWPIGKKDRKVFTTQVEARFRKLTKTYFFRAGRERRSKNYLRKKRQKFFRTFREPEIGMWLERLQGNRRRRNRGSSVQFSSVAQPWRLFSTPWMSHSLWPHGL